MATSWDRSWEVVFGRFPRQTPLRSAQAADTECRRPDQKASTGSRPSTGPIWVKKEDKPHKQAAAWGYKLGTHAFDKKCLLVLKGWKTLFQCPQRLACSQTPAGIVSLTTCYTSELLWSMVRERMSGCLFRNGSQDMAIEEGCQWLPSSINQIHDV